MPPPIAGVLGHQIKALGLEIAACILELAATLNFIGFGLTMCCIVLQSTTKLI
jgi:hypothetical protein